MLDINKKDNIDNIIKMINLNLKSENLSLYNNSDLLSKSSFIQKRNYSSKPLKLNNVVPRNGHETITDNDNADKLLRSHAIREREMIKYKMNGRFCLAPPKVGGGA